MWLRPGHMRPLQIRTTWVGGWMEGKEEAQSGGTKKCIRVPKVLSMGRGGTSFNCGQSTSSWSYLGLFRRRLVFPPQPLTSLCRGQRPLSPPRDLGILMAPPCRAALGVRGVRAGQALGTLAGLVRREEARADSQVVGAAGRSPGEGEGSGQELQVISASGGTLQLLAEQQFVPAPKCL